MNQVCKAIKESLHKDDWTISECTATNKKTGLKLWVGNGWPFFTGHNNIIHIPFFTRPILWYYMKKTITRGVIQALTE